MYQHDISVFFFARKFIIELVSLLMKVVFQGGCVTWSRLIVFLSSVRLFCYFCNSFIRLCGSWDNLLMLSCTL